MNTGRSPGPPGIGNARREANVSFVPCASARRSDLDTAMGFLWLTLFNIAPSVRDPILLMTETDDAEETDGVRHPGVEIDSS